jgi:hypothetical protein
MVADVEVPGAGSVSFTAAAEAPRHCHRTRRCAVGEEPPEREEPPPTVVGEEPPPIGRAARGGRP